MTRAFCKSHLPPPLLVNLRDAVDLVQGWHCIHVCRVGNVDPIRNHAARSIHDVQCLRIRLGRTGKRYAVVGGRVDRGSIHCDIGRRSVSHGNCALNVVRNSGALNCTARLRVRRAFGKTRGGTGSEVVRCIHIVNKTGALRGADLRSVGFG